MKIQLRVNGFEYLANFSEREVEEIYLPLLRRLTDMQRSWNRRIVVFLAAPPAVGKSTLAAFLETLSQDREELVPLQALSLDGFHYPNRYLKSHKLVMDDRERYLSEIKGMPETFDLSKFRKFVSNIHETSVKWPLYDRNLHDVVENQIAINRKIVLIEGNWLLLDEAGWSELQKYCDYSIFIHSDASVLKERLIARKIRGGLSRKEAEAFYLRSDGKNILRVMERRKQADLMLKMLPTGEKILLKEE